MIMMIKSVLSMMIGFILSLIVGFILIPILKNKKADIQGADNDFDMPASR